MARFSRLLAPVAITALLVLSSVAPARAQLPDCTGHDPSGASTEFEAGNALLTQAIEQASHRHADRARAIATEALAHFDRQCELGDTSAFAERGAALLMLGEPLRSAQSYDAYLALHPLDSLEARTRRRIEPNLQPGTLDLEVENARGRLFIDELDFGALPRASSVRVPYGEHQVEVRDADGTVIAADQVTLAAEASHVTAHLFVPAPEPEVVPVARIATPEPPPPPVAAPPEPAHARTDFLPFYIASGAVAAVGIAVGLAFVISADERARTYNSLCYPEEISGCTAVLSERDTALGISVVGFVVGGLGLAGLVTTWILDATQPRERVRVAFGPFGASVSGSF